ncbi:MAG: hypothetical protein ACW98X_16295 [Promethearchaeota archaeon]|jgi:tetratricopeptide (TPR) repeat protein
MSQNSMRISMHPELERGLSLLNEGKLEEAMQIINSFEQLKDITVEDDHHNRMLKANILLHMGKFQESLKISQQEYQKNKSQNRHLFLIDSITTKFFNIAILGGLENLREDVFLCEKLLESITEEPPNEIKLRKGYFLVMKAYLVTREGKLDKGIELIKKGLRILENYSVIANGVIGICLSDLGMSYSIKGELDLALEYWKKYLDLLKGTTPITNTMKGVTYHYIGGIHFQRGDLDQSIRYSKKSLGMLEQETNGITILFSGLSYDSIIEVLLFKDSLNEAKESLNHFYQYLELNKEFLKIAFLGRSPAEMLLYRISKARILASSSRVRKRAKAEEIIRKILEEKYLNVNTTRTCMLILCQLYFQEMKTSNNLEILKDIQPLIDKLIEQAEQINSFSQRAHAFLLNGKISLLRLNMGDARRFLTEAQQIADSHGLQLLAREISHEHDKLLNQLARLESYENKEITMTERMNIASLDDTLDLIQGRRAVNAPNLIDEEPVLLLIITIGGVLLFSYPFSDDVKVDDELFGGFLSAITAFSGEALSEELDRVKFGQYTVLMENIAEFSFCYLFKGQTYVAQKKFSNFTENFQKNTSMMQILNKFYQTSQVIELKDFPFLEGFIKEIFINR